MPQRAERAPEGPLGRPAVAVGQAFLARRFAGRRLAVFLAARFLAGRFLAAARFLAGRFFAVDLRAVDFLAVVFFAVRFLAGRLFAVDFLAALRAPAAAFFIALMFSPFLASLGGFEAYSAVAAYLAVLFPEGSLTARDARDASDIDAVTSASITFNIASLHGEVHQFERTFARTSSIPRMRGARRGSEDTDSQCECALQRVVTQGSTR